MCFFRQKKVLAESGFFRGFTDCHSHLLPGVDDGVKTLEESLAILEEMERLGVRKVWLTPHIMEDIPNETVDLQQKSNKTVTLQQKILSLKQKYQGKVELALAAEYMLDNLFEERLEKDDLLPFEEGKHYLLVETSYFNPPMGLLSILQRIQKKGYHPLLAHPERYEYMQMMDYKTLKKNQISFQLNIPSLVGMYGKHIEKKAKILLKAGMYDLGGNDVHSLIFYVTTCKQKIDNLSFLKNVCKI